MLYLLKMSGHDYYKIGYTTDNHTLKRRLKAHQTSCPRKIVVVATADGSEKDEQKLLLEFHRHKTDGGDEWYELTPELADKLKGHFQGEQQQNIISRGVERYPAFDVRPIRRGQQYAVGTNRQNVSVGGGLFDHPGHQLVQRVVRRKHKKRL